VGAEAQSRGRVCRASHAGCPTLGKGLGLGAVVSQQDKEARKLCEQVNGKALTSLVIFLPRARGWFFMQLVRGLDRS
jgi:hypothetical protein